MKAINKHQYELLTTKFADAIYVANHNVLANGIDELIPMYEELTGLPMTANCSDCKMDMMIILALAVKNYKVEKFVDKNLNEEK